MVPRISISLSTIFCTSRKRACPKWNDDNLAGRLKGIQNPDRCGLNGGALEGDVSATAVGQLESQPERRSLRGESVVSITGPEPSGGAAGTIRR